MRKKHEKKMKWLSRILAALAVLAALAGSRRGAGSRRETLYQLWLPLCDREGQPVPEEAVLAYIRGRTAEEGCGLAGGRVCPAEEGGGLVYFLLFAEEKKVAALAEELKCEFNLATVRCSQEEHLCRQLDDRL